MNTNSMTIKVDEEHLACAMGSGSLAVLATPAVVALMENAAAALADEILADGELKTTGVGIDNLLPPMRRFGGGSNRAEKKHTVIEKLKAFFEKFFGIV